MFNNYGAKSKRSIFSWIFLILLISGGCRETPGTASYHIVQSLVKDSCMVVAEHPLAAEAGLEILRAGGNAVDAAIVSQFVLAVVYPRAGNIGGGGYMLIRMSDGTTESLDYREKAPGAAFRDMYIDSMGNVIEYLSKEGHLAVGIPGTVAGLEAAFMRFSRLKDWKKLVQPAIDLAEEGFRLTLSEANRLNEYSEIFRKHNPDPAPFVKDGPWKPGDLLVQKDLAATLTRIREEGSAGFYSGKTAELIISEMQRGGGLITKEDLLGYQPAWRAPIRCEYRSSSLLTMPPSSSGGVAICQILKMLEPYPLSELGFHSVGSVHVIAEAERRAFADRATYLGDPDYYPVPIDSLLDDAYLNARMSDFDARSATKSDMIGNEAFKAIESYETTHTSIVDSDRNAVSVTTTLNLNYGSKVLVAGAGFFLNDEMDDFSAKPGVPNYFGLVGSEANAIEPGKRMLSSMTPTIVEKDDRLYMVIGAPGGSAIITAITQTLINVMDYQMPLDKAVLAPRFHHQWLPDEIKVEAGAIDTTTRKTLWGMGHSLREVNRMALIKAVQVLPDGSLHGAGDPRNPDDHAAGY